MSDNAPTVLEWIALVGTVATPLLLIVLSAIGWFIKSRFESSQALEQEARRRLERLESEIREERIQIYADILEPFIILFANDIGLPAARSGRGRRGEPPKTKEEVAIEKLTSLDYRRTAFRLSLFANDDVARAYNSLMQAAYSMGANTDDDSETGPNMDSIKIIGLFGTLLLAIRKSVGNERTDLTNTEMLEWMISDIRAFSNQLQAP